MDQPTYSPVFQDRMASIRHHLRKLKCSALERLLDFVLNHHPGAQGNHVSFVEEELRRSGWYDDDAFYGDMMPKAVLRAVRLHGIEGHSGMSNGIALGILERVCRFKPLTPLTGEPDEWNEVGEGTYQNRRFSSVFKDGADGQAYWIAGKVFREPSGACFTSKGSRVDVTFPFFPGDPETVDVDEDHNPS